MFKTLTGLVSLAMLIALISCNTATVKQDTRVVATYNKGQITLDNFQQDMLKNRFKDNLAQAAKSTVKEREDFLKSQITDKIIETKAAELKLDTLKSYRDNLKNAIGKLAKDQLYEDVVIKKVVKDEELKAEFEAAKKTVKAQHILIKSASPDESVKAKAKADSLCGLLTAGADFNELAAKFSDDRGNAEKGGDLGFFGRGQMVKPFEETAYGLKVNEVSKPVQTQFGWHIIKLNDIKIKEPSKSFEDSKNEVRLNIFRSRRDEAMKVTDDYIAYLRNHFGAKADSVNIQAFITKFAKVALLPDSLKNDSIQGFNEHDRNMVLVEYNGQKHSAKTIIGEFLSMPGNMDRPVYKNVNDVVKYYDRFLINDMLDKIIVEMGYEKDQNVISKAKEQLKPFFRQELEKKFAVDLVQDPSEEAKAAYYEANKEKLYKNKEEFRPYDEVKESIRTKLRREAEGKARLDWYDKLAAEAGFKTDRYLLEEAFYYVEDNKK